MQSRFLSVESEHNVADLINSLEAHSSIDYFNTVSASYYILPCLQREGIKQCSAPSFCSSVCPFHTSVCPSLCLSGAPRSTTVHLTAEMVSVAVWLPLEVVETQQSRRLRRFRSLLQMAAPSKCPHRTAIGGGHTVSLPSGRYLVLLRVVRGSTQPTTNLRHKEDNFLAHYFIKTL